MPAASASRRTQERDPHERAPDERAGDLEDHSRAIVLAQSKLASAGMEEALREGATQGDDGHLHCEGGTDATAQDELEAMGYEVVRWPGRNIFFGGASVVHHFTTVGRIAFVGGMTRFAAETAAAREQGMERWQVLKEIRDADRGGNPESGGDRSAAVARGRGAMPVPAMQPGATEGDRPMPERQPQAGRDRLALLALRPQRREVV